MPIGFFDKYFNEDDDDEQLILLSNQGRHNKGVFDMESAQEEEPSVLVEKKFNKQEEDDHAMKSRILQAAQQYMVCGTISSSDYVV